MSNPINEKRSMTVLLWNYLENRDIFLTFAGKMKKLVIIFTLLVALCCCTTEADRNRMRSGLDSINQRNRNGQPFTVQDVKPYVQFFDDHGTPNDRLLAHYLLGRAYYEAGEAPMALECYQKAAECADTTSKDCDYAQLCRVYAQMAEIFYDQDLYRQGLQCDKASEYYAWIAKDTLCALMSYEQKSMAYTGLGLKDSALLVVEEVSRKYKQKGYKSYASVSLGASLRTLLDKGEYQKVKTYLYLYETESGLFDSLGNIMNGREVYYNIKGYYYLKTGNNDSAKYFFYKELKQGHDFNNQNAASLGLGDFYKKLGISDSASKYYEYAYAMNDSVYAHQTTETIERMQSMYNFSRHQKIAQEEKEKAQRRIIIIWVCIGVIIFLFLITYIAIGILIRKRKKAEQLYNHSLSIIEQAQQDIKKLRLSENTNKTLISEKKQIIQEQNTILKSLLRKSNTTHISADKRLKESDIYQTIEQLSIHGQSPTDVEWTQLGDVMFLCFPGFKDFMAKHDHRLNDKELKTCMLIRCDFKPKVISHMLNVDPSYISHLRSDLLQKLFNTYGNSKTFDKMIKDIY